MVHFDLPELKSFGFDYFETLTDIRVEVADGKTTGDDMLWSDTDEYTMSEYIKDTRSGKTSLYLKYEDYDTFKTIIPGIVGKNVLTHLGGAIKKEKSLRDLGFWKEEWDEIDLNESNWSLWIGGSDTSTSIVSTLAF
jgi:hypothetical protein